MIDLHTHLYPEDDERCLSGLNELLNYHYVLGEFYKASGKLKDDVKLFNQKTKEERSEEIWDTLFRGNNKPRNYNSEHVNGVLTCIAAFTDTSISGGNIAQKSYSQVINSYNTPSLESAIGKAGLNKVVATYTPEDEIVDDDYVIPSIRIDNFAHVGNAVNDKALYYSFSCESSELSTYNRLGGTLFKDLTEKGIPFWVMLGVKREVTPYMGLGGDSIGECDILKLIEFANAHPNLKIPFSVLDSSKIHEAIVASRVTPNLYFAGHWWFNNIPSMIKQTTQTAVDLIGYENFIHYYSDARVVDQLYYKWYHFRHYQKEIGYELHLSNGRLWKTLFGAWSI